MVAGLQFGDEGKGSIVDCLVRETKAQIVVRYNGGPQAAHNVVTPNGRHHTFAQLGSGSFVGAATYLSRFMLIEPLAFMRELATFFDTAGFMPTVYVEEGCPIITPWHWRLNRVRERKRGSERHGSCGMGIGELRADIEAGNPILRAGDLGSTREQDILHAIRVIKASELRRLNPDEVRGDPSGGLEFPDYQWFTRNVRVVPNGSLTELASDAVVFEGAQGLLLDELWGCAPYNTWSDCTFGNAHRLIEGSGAEVTRLGVMRTYMTRHGAGPFPTEDETINHSDHNTANEWQGSFRQGVLDLSLSNYAVQRLGIDGVALTHCDRLDEGRLRMAYRSPVGRGIWWQKAEARDIERVSCSELARSIGVPVEIESYGRTANHKVTLVGARM